MQNLLRSLIGAVAKGSVARKWITTLPKTIKKHHLTYRLYSIKTLRDRPLKQSSIVKRDSFATGYSTGMCLSGYIVKIVQYAALAVYSRFRSLGLCGQHA